MQKRFPSHQKQSSLPHVLIRSCFVFSVFGVLLSCQRGAEIKTAGSLSDLKVFGASSLDMNNGFAGLISCNRRISSSQHPPFRMFYIHSTKGQKREVVILPDLRPERLGNYDVAYQERTVSPLDFGNHLSTGDWMVSNYPVIQAHDAKRFDTTMDNYSFFTSPAYDRKKFSKNGLLDISFDLKSGRVTRMRLNGGAGMRADQDMFPGFFYQVGSRPLLSSPFPKVDDQPNVFIRASCSESLTRGIFASVAVKKVETTNKGRTKIVKVKGYIDPVIAGRDRECIQYANAYDSNGNFYGIISSYDPVEEGFNPENIEITSVHDDRLKAYIRYGFARDYRGNGEIFAQDKGTGRKAPPLLMSTNDYYACQVDKSYTDRLALESASNKLSAYMQQPTCVPEDLEVAFCDAKSELNKLIKETDKARKSPLRLCSPSELDNSGTQKLIKGCGSQIVKLIGESCKTPEAE